MIIHAGSFPVTDSSQGTQTLATLGEHLPGRPAARTYEAEPVGRDGDG